MDGTEIEAVRFGNTAVSEGRPGFVSGRGRRKGFTEVISELSLEEVWQLGRRCGVAGVSQI